MRVLTTGRTGLALAIIAGVTAVTLPASAGATAQAVKPAGEVTTRVAAHVGHVPAAAHRATTGVALGPAVAYVREADGTVRRVR